MSLAASNPESDSTLTAPTRNPRRFLLLFAVPAAILTASTMVYLHGGRYVETENAYVKATKVPVSGRVSGMVREVLVSENQTVAIGQPLYRLDPGPFRVAVMRAEARLAQVRADLAAQQAAYREKEAEIRLAQTRVTFARKEQQRMNNLLAQQYVSPSQVDQAEQNAEVAARETGVQQADLQRLAALLGGNVNAPVEQLPAYQAALADLEQARLELDWTEVRATMPGAVGKPPKVGQFVEAGASSMSLVVNGAPWVEANFPENDLTYVHPGQPVTVRIDTYPGRQWTGEVDSLSPTTGSELSVIPAQNATGNWVKVVQRVPVRIRLNESKDSPPLRAGLSAIVEIDTGHQRHLPGL
ncbi:membrane fusion protein (multidrug efflux system) [Fluviicoccus keumensis]|uniref:Membrane fusion protein (Multidrug efflux system) n=1 Tax=Fluviicoccus keumensis TaxID=1435465 RepID=A0A4Q7ZB19_9GAMM|nr:HlyD family secretion protein [Fluviicoccus keumensis]RZU47133.1 membrane fusion protein (multidrug efflux system) [Fluviicoccus keumensis]